MKKFFKFGCLGIIALIVLIIILVALVGGDDEEKQPVSSNPQSTTDKGDGKADKDEPKTNVDEKLVTVDQDFKVNGLDIKIGEITITKKDVKIGMTVNNTTGNTLSFYPDQGSIVIGNTQVDANMFMTKGDVSGDILAGVEKTGTLRFLAPDDKEFTPNEIKEIKLAFGNVLDSKTFSSEDFQQTITIE